jgi:hypothetical protein
VSWPETAVTAAAVLLVTAALAGVTVRGRASVCWTFVLYLGVIAVADLLMLLWPDRFWRLWFYMSKELVIDVLRFAVALELTYRTFRAFPSARATARGVLLLVLVITLAIVVVGTGDLEPAEGGPALGPLATRVQPRVLNGSIWLLTAIAGLILWYRLPVHPLHKAILVGLVPYLLVFSVSMSLIESHGWDVRGSVNYLYTLAFLLVLIYWAFATWRRNETPLQAPPFPTDPKLGRVTG